MHWLAEIKVSPEAAEYRQSLSVQEFQEIARTIEYMAMSMDYPVAEITDGVLRSLASDEPLADGTPLTKLIIEMMEMLE